MTTTIFNLIDSVNREGIDNSVWGLTEFHSDIFADEFFGSDVIGKIVIEKGKYLYLYVESDDSYCFIKTETCDLSFQVSNDTPYPTVICLWKL